jgi:hypothetical protein
MFLPSGLNPGISRIAFPAVSRRQFANYRINIFFKYQIEEDIL